MRSWRSAANVRIATSATAHAGAAPCRRRGRTGASSEVMVGYHHRRHPSSPVVVVSVRQPCCLPPPGAGCVRCSLQFKNFLMRRIYRHIKHLQARVARHFRARAEPPTKSSSCGMAGGGGGEGGGARGWRGEERRRAARRWWWAGAWVPADPPPRCDINTQRWGCDLPTYPHVVPPSDRPPPRGRS